MTTGSVRGKCSALQAGQARFQPASTRSVAAPQFEQKRCRACQCSIALASASGGRWSASTRPWIAIERRSMTNKIVARLQRLGAGLRDADAEARGAVEQAEEHRLGDRRERARLVRRERRIVHVAALLQHDQLAADHIAERARVGHAAGEPGRVETALGDAVDQAFGVAEVRPWPELQPRGDGTQRHATDRLFRRPRRERMVCDGLYGGDAEGHGIILRLVLPDIEAARGSGQVAVPCGASAGTVIRRRRMRWRRGHRRMLWRSH